jgi:hypothetical protein
MDRKSPGKIEGYLAMRIGAAIFSLIAVCATAGCMSQLKANSPRPVDTSMDVFAQASVLQHSLDKACMFVFSAPPEIEADSAMVTSAYQARLLQRSPFARISLLDIVVSSDAQALWYARKRGCSLAIVPSLLYLMDGSGGLPTRLIVRIRILDAASGQVLWDIKQSAWSEPGPDIDLTWNTIVGAPAQRCHILADCLAEKFAGYLAQHLEEEKKEQAGGQQ